MATGTSTNSGPTDEERLAAVAEYQRQKRKVDEENGVLRAILKRLKSSGINTKAMIATVQASKKDPQEVLSDTREMLRFMALRNMPTTQMDLFPDGESAIRVAENARAKDAEWTVDEAGYRAGFNAVPAEDNPHPPGSEFFVIWQKSWHDGQAALVRKTMSEGTEVASASRARPERRNTSTDAPEATSTRRSSRQPPTIPARGRRARSAGAGEGPSAAVN